MRISEAGSPQFIQRTQRLQAACLDGNQALTPAHVAGLHKFYGQVLNTIEGLGNGEVGRTRQITPEQLEQVLPDRFQEIGQATAPRLNDNGDARQLRADYRRLLRELRRESTRAINSGENTRTTPDGRVRTMEWRSGDHSSFCLHQQDPDGASSRLELLGSTVRRSQTRQGATQVEQFRLDDQGQPVRELLLAFDGSAPQRIIARPDGSAQWQHLQGPTLELSAARQESGDVLPTPWWRERDPQQEWEVETTPAAATAPGPGQAIASLSPTQAALVADHYELFGGDLRADVARNPSIAQAIRQFGETAKEQSKARPKPKPAPISADKVRQDTKDFCAIFERLFAKLDANHDGKIDLAEVKKALHDPSIKNDDAAALAALFSLVQMEDGLPDGLTREKLAEIKSGASGSDLNEFIANLFKKNKTDLGWKSRDVFTGGEPLAEAVKQGYFGTCYFLAALVAKAKADPESVKKMIKDNGNGTYTVTFPGARAVTIQAPTDAELLVHASAGSNGMWATIIEKAYGQMRNQDAKNPKAEPMDQVEGGSPYDGIPFLTKKGLDVDDLWVTFKSTTRSKIQKALKEHKMITCRVKKGGSKEIQDGHVYTVIGYDPKSDMVTIRNPWGEGGPRAEPQNPDGTAKDGNMDGVFQLTISQFDEIFTGIAYEE
ncbi:MAG: C2 family cysteine protease [Vulcanimicrobiota bacterium]